MADNEKTLPPIDATLRPFWDGAKQHKLMLFKCVGCGRYYWPAIQCPACEDSKMEWVQSSGKGKIYTFTIMHQAYPTWQANLPYNISWVKLNEGPIILSNLIGCKNENIFIGMDVEVVFEDVTEDVVLTKFRPVIAVG